MSYFVCVDIGTTCAKAILYDDELNNLANVDCEYPLYHAYPDWAEQDPELIFQAVLDSVGIVVKQSGVKKEAIAFVAFSSAMHGVIAMDSANQPLTPCMIWADTRSAQQARDIQAEGGLEIYRRTGTPIHPMSPLPKLIWLRQNRPTLFASASKFVSLKEYVLYKLFGRWVVDESIASATGLYDVFDRKWNQQALDLAAISPERLAKPIATTAILEGMNPIYAERMGLSQQTPVVAGASDGCLANLGSGAVKVGSAAVTIGTSGAVRVVADQAATDPLGRTFCYILDDNKYVLGGPINNGGVAYRWWRDQIPLTKHPDIEKNYDDPYIYLNYAAEQVPAGAGGLLFLPFLVGERAPWWNPDTRGMFFGINIKHDYRHFTRAILEGIIFSLYSVAEILEEATGPILDLRATGGFVRSQLWLQILSDIFQKEVHVPVDHNSACLGAALIGLKAVGKLASLDQGLALLNNANSVYPNQTNQGIYEELFLLYKELYHSNVKNFAAITKLQKNH